MVKVEAAWEALGLQKERDPMKRLAFYLQKPMTYRDAVMAQQQAIFKYQEWQAAGGIGTPPKVPPLWSWETQRAYMPRDFEEDWADFNDLRERAERGEFSTRARLAR